jgi:hypothetical protein
MRHSPGGLPVLGQNPLFQGDCLRNPTAGQAYTGFTGSQSGGLMRSINGIFRWIGGHPRRMARKCPLERFLLPYLNPGLSALPVVYRLKTGLQGVFAKIVLR